MLFKNYHIVILRDKEDGFKNLKIRGGVGVILFFLIIGLIVLNAYLWSYYSRTGLLEHELIEARRLVSEQESQLLGLSVRMDELSTNLRRVQTFDSRLRVLLNVDKENGAPQEENDSDSQETSLMGSSKSLLQHKELFARQAFSLANELNNNAFLEELTQQQLLLYMRDNKERMLSIPSIWPARGRFTSPFGYRSSPFTRRSQTHKGIDLANKIGTPVWATAHGTVLSAQVDSGYGKCVVINHGNNIITRYAHLNSLLVRPGQIIKRGEIIGTMGNTGRTTGPHLHYEVHVSGVAVNPMRYILN